MLKTTKAQLQNLSSWLLSRRAANDCLKTLTPAAGASCGVRTFLKTKTPFFYGQIEFMHVLIFQMLLTVLKVITVYLHRSLKNRIFGGCSSDSAFILRKWRFFITKNYELSKNNGSDVFFGGSRTMRLVPQNASSRNRLATCATSRCESATDVPGLGTTDHPCSRSNCDTLYKSMTTNSCILRRSKTSRWRWPRRARSSLSCRSTCGCCRRRPKPAVGPGRGCWAISPFGHICQ